MLRDGEEKSTKEVESEEHLWYKDGKVHRALDSDWRKYGNMEYWAHATTTVETSTTRISRTNTQSSMHTADSHEWVQVNLPESEEQNNVRPDGASQEI